MTTPELKPCPFCGSDAEYSPSNNGSARCSKGRSLKNPLVCAGAYIFVDLAQWNTRPADPEKEALRVALKQCRELLLMKSGEYSDGDGDEVRVPISRWKRMVEVPIIIEKALKLSEQK